MAEPRLDLDGPAAPPRRNGELAFEAPWESRLFGVTLALCEAGRFEWEEFRALLIEEVARADAAGAPERFHYYGCWQAAFERLVAAKGLCAAPELEARARALAARPAGHDHRHDHAQPRDHDDAHGHDPGHSDADAHGPAPREPRR